MNLKKLAASATFALAVSGAFAQEAAPIQIVLNPSGPSTFAATFQRSVTGFFLDTFDFTPASFSGLVSVSLRPVSGPVNFFSALLGNDGFGFLPENGLTTFDFQSNLSAASPFELVVLGFAGDADILAAAPAVYSGTITAQAVAAIPEPETYALLLAGLAVLGAVGRRRARSALRIA